MDYNISKLEFGEKNMIEYDRINNQIKIGADDFFRKGFLCGIALACMGIALLIDTLPWEEGYTEGDIFGTIFLLVWILGVIAMSLIYLADFKKRIFINDEGVLYITWNRKKFLYWNEIKDFGLSYYGNNGMGLEMYYLYFSKKKFEKKNESSKKLKGSIIKTCIMCDKYDDILSVVIPFCKERISVEPFIAKE